MDGSGRRYRDIGELKLESGELLSDVRLAYETWGELAPDGGNAVLVEHALTGDSHVVGPAGPDHPSPGWWEGMVGPGAPIDTDRYFVVAPNVLGGCRGSTGPTTPGPDGLPWGGRFPFTTVRDQVAAEAALADELGIRRWAGVIGGSMGGMRALEWAVSWPDRVASLLVLASSAAASAEQIGLCSAQIHAIRADPVVGLGIARRIAHLSYRSEAELADRFGRAAQPGEDPLAGGRYAVESYLDHHAAKLTARFDPYSYIALSAAMNSHDVGRGRGGAEVALARVTARTVVVGIDSDRLYPIEQQRLLAEHIPDCAGLQIVSSAHGHDGFLIEIDAIGQLVRDLLPSTVIKSGSLSH